MIEKTKDILKGPKFKIGDWTYGNIQILGTHLLDELKIGKFCSIGSSVRILIEGWHHNPECISTYPFLSSYMRDEWPEGSKVNEPLHAQRTIEIGNDVWIGDSALILSNVKIGHGAVIGTRTVISKDIPAYSIVVGSPCQILKRRFSDEEVDFLLRLKWWDWPREEIAKNLDLICSNKIKELMKRFAYILT